MTDTPQRSLSGYKSQVHEQGEYDNPNEGKPVLNDSDEYVFRLTAFPNVKSFDQIKEKKDGTRTTVKVDKAICIFEEEQTKNIVTAFFRVDSLNFSEDEAFESAVVRFFKKIKIPLVEGVSPDWDKYFITGMRFRGRVAIGKDAEKKPNAKYFLDIPTCRPLGSAVAPDNGAASAATLSNAKFIAKGAKDYKEAEEKLRSASAPKELLMAIFQAELDGKMTYPI